MHVAAITALHGVEGSGGVMRTPISRVWAQGERAGTDTGRERGEVGEVKGAERWSREAEG